MLVAAAVVIVLISLVIAGLAKARSLATSTHCLANCRSSAQILQLYASDFKNIYPYLAQRRQFEDAFINGVSLRYDTQVFHWPAAARMYLRAATPDPVQICPSLLAELRSAGQLPADTQYSEPSSYWMSYSTIASPAVWRSPPPAHITDELRAVRSDEVLFPSLKGLLVEVRVLHARGSALAPPSLLTTPDDRSLPPLVVALSDGAARQTARANLTDPWPSPPPGWYRAPVLSTLDGASGRDFAP